MSVLGNAHRHFGVATPLAQRAWSRRCIQAESMSKTRKGASQSVREHPNAFLTSGANLGVLEPAVHGKPSAKRSCTARFRRSIVSNCNFPSFHS